MLNDLAVFSKGLKLKRNRLGLMCAPGVQNPNATHRVPGWDYLMGIVKRSFPNIPFSGFFNDDKPWFFGTDSTKNGEFGDYSPLYFSNKFIDVENAYSKNLVTLELRIISSDFCMQYRQYYNYTMQRIR